MKVLNKELDLNLFLEKLRKADKKVLILDYDGTLAPFRHDPMSAVPYEGIRELLQRLMERESNRLIIVGGRWIKHMIPLLGLEKLPEIWGSHGLERLKSDGTYQVARMEEKELKGLAEADLLIEEWGLNDSVENKPGCLALHWRGKSEREIFKMKNKVLREWSKFPDLYGLSLENFDGGLELRAATRDKGDVVRTILRETDPAQPIAYVGDDLTDEDAFSHIKGKGIGVLVGNECRQTHADIWLKPPDELFKFLDNWL